MYIFWPLLFSCVAVAAMKNRIVGGNSAYAGQFMFTAAIYKTQSDGYYFCGGTLISTSYVVTAGQCVTGASYFRVILGATNLQDTGSNVLELQTGTYIVHPDFNPETLENDIGLIQFRLPIQLTSYVNTIDFLPVSDTAATTETIAVGWGQVDDATPGLVDNLRWATLTVLSDEECKLVYGTQIQDGMMCAAGNYNEGICHGDTGSPLIQDVGRGYRMLVGIASFISGNGCESTDPSGYTKFYPYVDWIYNVTAAK